MKLRIFGANIDVRSRVKQMINMVADGVLVLQSPEIIVIMQTRSIETYTSH
jgi:hypothetical protein